MGYTLRIGELEVDYSNDIEYPHMNFDAVGVEHDDAPAFGEPTDRTNSRWPSYSAWHDFCCDTGLHDLFFSKEREDALLTSHPGCVPLTEKHRSEINAALSSFMKIHPNAVATYGNIVSPFERDPSNPPENGTLCRLTWLHYWVNWAMDNCERPVFYNS